MFLDLKGNITLVQLLHAAGVDANAAATSKGTTML
jgi:hypothetical protein